MQTGTRKRVVGRGGKMYTRVYPPRYVSVREKTNRAYRAYKDLLETAEWFRELAERHVRSFEMSLEEFRVMETIYREGPKYQKELSWRFQRSKQSIAWVIRRLERAGWVQRKPARLRPGQMLRDGWSGDRGPERRERSRRRAKGRPIVRIFLTAEGRETIFDAMRKHAKYIQAEMRALDGREQQTLSRLCGKLREGDPVRFFREIQRGDWGSDEIRSDEFRALASRIEKLNRRLESHHQPGGPGPSPFG